MPIRNRIMLIATLVAALTLAACASTTLPPAPTPIPTLAPAATPTLVSEIVPAASAGAMPAAGQDAAALGAAIFEKHCTRCHGALGEGVDAPALRNNKFIQTGSDQDVFDTIANGRSGTEMPAWLQANGGALTADQITEVVAYLRTLQQVESLPTATPLPPEPTEAPGPEGGPTPVPAQPSNGGGLGAAASLTGDPAQGQIVFGQYCAACHGPEGVQGVPNPGSDDGSVPPLNPIDSTLVNADSKVFAANLDLFLEHGSTPEGDSPMIVMPSFGDSKLLSDQQIADAIAYVMSLNGVK
jgi:mono/diheme cytochrome c family protein